MAILRNSLIVSSFCNNKSILIRPEEPWKKFPIDEEDVLTSERLKELEEFERLELERLEALAINETAKSKNIPLEPIFRSMEKLKFELIRPLPNEHKKTKKI